MQLGPQGNGTQGSSTAAGTQSRDFTLDDFPALGGPTQSSQHPQPSQTNPADGHPPGLNGFQNHGDQQHRQNLLGSLTGAPALTPSLASGQQQPGLLNLGQARNVHTGFQSDVEKQRVRN